MGRRGESGSALSYRDLVENSLGLICTHDLRGKLLSINPAAGDLLGYAPAELIGSNLRDLLVPATRPLFDEYLSRLRELTSDSGFMRVLTRQGEERILYYRNRLCHRPGRNPYVLGHAQDLTDQKRAERELSERARLAAFTADVSAALTRSGGLDPALQQVAEAMIRHLGDIGAVWVASDDESELELVGSIALAGLDLQPRRRVPVGQFRVGEVARTRRQILADLRGEPRADDGDWADRLGMIAFAGQPLIVAERLVGVMSLFSAHSLTQTTLTALSSVADTVALAIDRDRTIERLRESEARYRSLFEESPVGIYRTTPQGQVLLVNPALVRMLGYSSADPLLARNLEKERPDALYDRRLFRDLVEREGGIQGLEVQWQRQDGSLIWVREHAKTVRAENGEVLFYEGTVEDISEPRRARQELLSSHGRRAATVEAALDGILSLDAQGRIFEFNPAAEAVLGWLPEEALGRPMSDLLVLPGFRPSGHDGLESYLATGEGLVLGRRIETQGRRADGTVFPLELAITRLPGDGPATFTAFLRDLSERHEVERLKTQFVATVSHELRTPLTSLRGALGLLAGGVLGDLPPKARDAIEIAQRSILRLVGLVNDILDIERLEHGRLSLHVERHALADLLARSIEEVGALAKESGIVLDVDPPAGEIEGDGNRLVQVLVNLLSNAFKFSPRGSTVRLRTRTETGWVEIRIEDQGRGIPSGHREVIFDRFRQVELSDAAGQRGAGLGLAIAKSIVELHGGSIGVHSAEGQGSTFWFRIPRGSCAS